MAPSTRARFGRAARPRRFCIALVVALGALTAPSGPAAAEEVWAVRSGQAVIHLNVDLLHDLGIDVEVTGATPISGAEALIEEPAWTFSILPGSDLSFRSEHQIVQGGGSTGGSMRLAGGLVLRDRASGRTSRLFDLEIAHASDSGRPGEGAPLVLRSTGTRIDFCRLRNSMFDFRAEPVLRVYYLNACITDAWAQAIGRPDLAGWVIGMGQVQAGAERLSASPPSRPAYQPVFTGGVLDVSLGELEGIQSVGHAGTYPSGTAALAMSTTSCNVGSVDVPWLAPMEEPHPLIHMALYRLLNGRFEQIGVSWMKHGFFALSNNQCTPCQNPSNGTFLGIGCSDTYDVSNNSNRSYLGPRSEVSIYKGTWECTGSHFSGGVGDCVRRHGSGGHGVLDHRLIAADADLANVGATYYYEAYYVVQDDQALDNNWGHRRCTMTWNGSAWVFSTPGSNPLVEGPALESWGGSNHQLSVATGDGDVLVSVKTTDLGGGAWHYEYALLNRNSERQIRSFSLPVSGVSNVTNIGFHDNDANGANDWQVTADGSTITWQTETFAQNPNANALGFGYMYNFRFDADSPPTTMNATLGLFKPGTGTSVDASTSGPTNVPTAVEAPGRALARVIDVRPNPFARSATIWYQARPGAVDLSIYDTAGRLVRRLADHSDGSEIQSVAWNGDSDQGLRARPGVYYARLSVGPTIAVKSLVLVD